MKTSTVRIFFILFPLFLTAASAQEKIVAMIHKPVGNVEFKKAGGDWQKAKPATPLADGNLVRTGENSFAVIKFIENSLLRVQEKSEITIHGEISKKTKEFSKNVYLGRGELGFDVKKQKNEKFEFSTPTSVASIRGTGGLLIAGADSNDVLILQRGVVDFLNNFSNQIVTVNGGQSAFSFSNGSITVKESSPEELRLLEQSSIDSTSMEGKNEGGESEGSSTSTTGITLGLSISAPLLTENTPLKVAVEISNASISLDSLKNIITEFSLSFRAKPEAAYSVLSATAIERTTYLTIPAQEVFAPSMQVFAKIRLKDGSEFTVPASSPEQNPILLPVQDAKRNELKIEYTDPTGKRKKLIIEYK